MRIFRARDDISDKAIAAMWALVGNAEEFKRT
jgi:hypothetical protein